tara:strand:- start:3387 stop:5072 length:1686 start_codon:yes stop_codon:yes gene_type:complete
MRNLIVISSILLLIACKSTYEDTLKSRDVGKKEKLAFELYENQDYYKASDLFKSLIQDKKTGSGIEKMFFYYAMCDYQMGDFGLAAYEFERLVQKFPRGLYTEESQFYIGMSNFEKSPPSFLDQDYTYRAIESFQLFLDKYPNSKRKNEVNQKVDELTKKLEFKMYMQAKLFYQMGEYKSSAVFFDNLLVEFPDTEFAEEASYLIAESQFKLAKKSVEAKQIERYKKSVGASNVFDKKYKESDYKERVSEIKKNSQEEIIRLRKELPEYYLKTGAYDKAIGLYETLLRRSKIKSEKQDFSLQLFKAYHAKCQKANTQYKVKNYENLMSYYNGLSKSNSEYINMKLAKEVESARLGYFNYRTNAAYQLYKEGKYRHSIAQYKKLLNDTSLSSSSKDWYFFLLANYKLALNQEAQSREFQLDTIMSYWPKVEGGIKSSPSGYDLKLEKIRKKTENSLKDFPVALVKEPYENGRYKLALNRAQTELRKKLSKKDEEEIVYLQIAASLKYAKKGKRFERYERFTNTQKLFKMQSYKIKDEHLKGKADKLEGKIEKGIIKYKINEV